MVGCWTGRSAGRSPLRILLAARKLGLTEVPCIELAYLTDAQRRAYIIADNKLALNAGWDEELLKLELGELKFGGFDVSLTGFGELELDALLADKTEGRADPDDVPPPPEHPVSEPGDGCWVGTGCCAVIARSPPTSSACSPVSRRT